jgi:hypothetical protein
LLSVCGKIKYLEMNLQERIVLMARLGDYMRGNEPEWEAARERAALTNNWFTREFIQLATTAIAGGFLTKDILEQWTAPYHLPDTPTVVRKVGIVMAGNIPLVGFHDLLCVFISGHHAVTKPSSRDEVLIRHLADKLIDWDPRAGHLISFAELLKGCDAYIATGSNNSAGYFDYYFGKYPHLIRRNRTSVAILTGDETPEELDRLADDVYLYFGLGCRNVTKLYVPEGYNFEPLLRRFDKYNYLGDHHKYKNNYDYNLALHLLNKKPYMSNEALLLVEEEAIFSPISQLNFGYYSGEPAVLAAQLAENAQVQCVVGKTNIPFGQAQQPGITDYADGEDTLAFLKNLA